jgi:motility quorum-sensing regulator/GCU-specific mRNA interferase toxin
MEKLKAHYDLKAIKAVVEVAGIAAFTNIAQAGIKSLSLTDDEAIAVVMGLKSSMLYKSMTTHADHKTWQDVYHAPCPNGKTAYIKLTAQAGSVVIQFKEI